MKREILYKPHLHLIDHSRWFSYKSYDKGSRTNQKNSFIISRPYNDDNENTIKQIQEFIDCGFKCKYCMYPYGYSHKTPEDTLLLIIAEENVDIDDAFVFARYYNDMEFKTQNVHISSKNMME